MAEIDVKFLKGNKTTAKKMGSTYKRTKRTSVTRKKTK